MSESCETTETFKNLLTHGLVTKQDLVTEGFHKAASAVMVDQDNSNVTNRRGTKKSACEDVDDNTKSRRLTGTSRARETEGDETFGDDSVPIGEKEKRKYQNGPAFSLAGEVGGEIGECATTAAAAVTAGFSKLADEIGRMFISDQEQLRAEKNQRGGYEAEEEDEEDAVDDFNRQGEADASRFDGLRGGAYHQRDTEEDLSSPLVTEGTILKTMCGPLLGLTGMTESPKQVRAEFGVAEEPITFTEHREPPATMM